jgi:hypothetical protein
MGLLQADAEKVPGFESHRGKCEPVFLMYKVRTNSSHAGQVGMCEAFSQKLQLILCLHTRPQDGSLKETVTGVQLPQITQCISRLLGDMPAV